MKKKFLIPIILSLGLSGCNFPGLPGLNHGNNNESSDNNNDNTGNNETNKGPLDQASFTKFIQKFNTEGCSYILEEDTYRNNEFVEKLKTDYRIDLVNNEYYAFLTEYYDSGMNEVTKIIKDGYAYMKEGFNSYYSSFKAPADQIAHQLKLEQESNKFLLIPSDNLSDYGYDSERSAYTYKGEFPSPIQGDNSTYTYDMSYSYNLTGRSYINGTITVRDSSDGSNIKLDIQILEFVVGTPTFGDFSLISTLANKQFRFDKSVHPECSPQRKEELKQISDRFYGSVINFGTNVWEWHLQASDDSPAEISFGEYSEVGGGLRFAMYGAKSGDTVNYFESPNVVDLYKDINNKIVLSIDLSSEYGDNFTLNLIFDFYGNIVFTPTEGLEDINNNSGSNNQPGHDNENTFENLFNRFYSSMKNDGFYYSFIETQYVNSEFYATFAGECGVNLNAKSINYFDYVQESEEDLQGSNLAMEGENLFRVNDNNKVEFERISECEAESYLSTYALKVDQFFPSSKVTDYTENVDGSYKFNKSITYPSGSDILAVNYDLTYHFDLEDGSLIMGTIDTIYRNGRSSRPAIRVDNLYVGDLDMAVPYTGDLAFKTFKIFDYSIDDEYWDAPLSNGMSLFEFAQIFIDSEVSFYDQENFLWTVFDSNYDPYIVFDGIYNDGLDILGPVEAYAIMLGEEISGSYISFEAETIEHIYRGFNRKIIYGFTVEDNGSVYVINFELTPMVD